MEKPWAFVTGISQGVGKSVAIKLAKQEYHVIGLSRSKPAYVSDYPDIYWFFFDLSKDFRDDLFDSSIRKHTHTIRLVILNAAYAYYGKIEDTPPSQFERIIKTNLLSNIRILRHLLPMMKEGSQVVFVGSSIEYHPAPNMGMYGALKAAQSHLAMTLNVECVHRHIRFKVIRPGLINTSFARKAGDPLNRRVTSGLHPDKVADDIIRLTRRKRLILNCGWVSKLLNVLNRLSDELCLRISTKRHRARV